MFGSIVKIVFTFCRQNKGRNKESLVELQVAQAVCVTRFDQSESAIQTIASPKKKRVFALARVENFVCVTAFAIGFWKLFSSGILGKYSNIGSGSFFL